MSDKGISLDSLLGMTHTALRGVEARIVDEVISNLTQKVAGTWQADDDALFGPLSAYVKPAWELQWPWRAIRMWLVELAPHVASAEEQLGERIHKGAPIYNTGLCFFMAGDFARSIQYIAAAAEEDEATHGGKSRLLEGKGIGEEMLLRPLYAWLDSEFGADYAAGTGINLSASEFKDLLDFLARRQPDALLSIMALHRFAKQVEGPNNAASRLQRVRAFADLLLVFESSLRQWQVLPPPPRAELCRRATELLRPCASAFGEFNLRLSAYPRADWEDSTVVDAMVRQEEARFDAASTVAERAAVAVFVSYRLRNSVMHVLDDQLELFEKPELLRKVLGFALVSIRMSRFGADGQLGGL